MIFPSECSSLIQVKSRAVVNQLIVWWWLYSTFIQHSKECLACDMDPSFGQFDEEQQQKRNYIFIFFYVFIYIIFCLCHTCFASCRFHLYADSIIIFLDDYCELYSWWILLLLNILSAYIGKWFLFYFVVHDEYIEIAG